MAVDNTIFDQLCELGVCDREQIAFYHQGTREREDIAAYTCLKTGAIFLDRCDHMDMAHYEQKAPTHKHGTIKRGIVNTNDDALRRKARFTNLIRNRRWVDVGAGSGAVLDQLSQVALETAAIEPQQNAGATLRDLGYRVYNGLSDLDEKSVDVISLFHVLEHLVDPLTVLRETRDALDDGGWVIVEVPHAKDMLLSKLDCASFKAFTLWSEHLFLHTRTTLEALVSAAGFKDITIEGVQRYPVANHLHWLSQGKPGGNVEYDVLRDPALDAAYGNLLQRLDMTDTILLTARK